VKTEQTACHTWFESVLKFFVRATLISVTVLLEIKP